jgi:hypothetical protein
VSQRSVFKRAGSENFSRFTGDGGLGTFAHRRQPIDIDEQDVIRTNGDTLLDSEDGERSEWFQEVSGGISAQF